MKVRGKVTPKLRARVLQLRAEGLSYRKMEAQLELEGTPLSVQGCHDVVKANGSDPGEGKAPTPKPRAPRPRAPRLTKTKAEAEAPKLAPPARPDTDDLETDLPEVPELPELPAAAPIAARVVYRILRKAHDLEEQIHPRVSGGDYPVTQYVAAVKNIVSLTRELHALLPKPKPDPAHDPHNTGARDALVERERGIVEAAELRAGRLCPRCAEVVGARA